MIQAVVRIVPSDDDERGCAAASQPRRGLESERAEPAGDRIRGVGVNRRRTRAVRPVHEHDLADAPRARKVGQRDARVGVRLGVDR